MSNTTSPTTCTIGVPAHSLGMSTTRPRRFVRVSGSATSASLETAPPEHGSPWVPQRVAGTVRADGDGWAIESPELSAESARALASHWRLALRDAGLVRPERGRRYLTQHYAALDRIEAERLARVDGTPLDSIRVADAEIVHSTTGWALWSDGRVTTAIGLPRWAQSIRELAADAERLISDLRGADGGRLPAGGYRLLVQVARVTETAVALGGDRGIYARARVDRLDLELRDGTTAALYRVTEGYPEGYRYDLYDELQEVTEDLEAELASRREQL